MYDCFYLTFVHSVFKNLNNSIVIIEFQQVWFSKNSTFDILVLKIFVNFECFSKEPGTAFVIGESHRWDSAIFERDRYILETVALQ